MDVNLTLLPVTVLNESSGEIVNGLRREQFTVIEDKAPQPIVAFSSDDTLCSVGLLFDTSGSMEHKIDKARLAMAHLFEVLNPEDEVFLMSFAEHPELRSDFTSNFASLQDTFLFTRPTGRTALFDAVYLGLQRMRTARNPRRAVVVISDGGDNDSRYSSKDLFEYAMEADVQIHALGVRPDRYGTIVLDAMADATGGLSITVDKLEALGDAMNTIGRALHNQYLIGYYSPHKPNGKKWRKVQVRVTSADGHQRLRAYTRSGYFGPE
jgi:Ca-activated chloride channel family protein